MRRVSVHTVTASLVLSAVAAAAPKFVSTWKAPGAASVSFAGKKVAALVISTDQSLRVAGEEALVRELAAIGLAQGVATYRIVPAEELRDPEKAKGWYERAGVEGLVAMRLVKADKRQTWTPSTWSSGYYSTLSGYYGYGWGSVYVYDPGSTREDEVAVIETVVFSVPQNTLLWASVTETTNPKNAARTIEEVVSATVKEMTRQGLLRRTAK